MKRYFVGLCAFLLLLVPPMTAMGEGGMPNWNGHEDDWATGATPVPAQHTLPSAVTPAVTDSPNLAAEDDKTADNDTTVEEKSAEATLKSTEGFEPSQGGSGHAERESPPSVNESGVVDEVPSATLVPADGTEPGSQPLSNDEPTGNPVSTIDPIPTSEPDVTAGTKTGEISVVKTVPHSEASGIPAWLTALLALLMLLNCVALGIYFLHLNKAIRDKLRKNDHIGIGRGQ